MEHNDLRKAGLKVTVPRVKILQILEEAPRRHPPKRHLSAEDVYKTLLEAGEDVGLATVYRVLTQFEAAAIVTRHHFEGEHSVFELNEGEHHDHLVCIKCGIVEEFVDDIIEERQNIIAKNMHFTITDHSLTIFGLCEKCQE